MSTSTGPFALADLRYVVGLSEAGQTHQQIATALIERGIAVPRWDGAGPASSVPSGYNLPTDVGDPSRWTAEAVAAVLAAPEADPTDHYAAARAKLGSDATTTLTVA